MNVSAYTQTGYIQSTNKTTATKATSAYESTTSTQTPQTDTIEEKKEPTKATTEVQTETKERLTTEQEIQIKQQTAQITSETEKSSLATAIQESSQPQAMGRMAQMEEKYKDIYTPMPEKFSQEIEDLQTKLIRERYPDYLTFDEFAEKYLVPIESPTPEAEAKAKALQDAKMAESIRTEGPNQYNGGVPYVRDEERDAFIASIMRQYPNNTQDKYFSNLTNSPQRARAYNAAVYEGLEAGESLVDASAKAGQVQNTYIDNTEMFDEQFSRSRKFFHEYYDEVDKRAEEERQNTLKDPLPDQNPTKYNGTVLDLREYGFDREITTLVLLKSNNAMVASIQEQIKFFDFILKNQDIVQGKYEELDEKYKQQNGFDETIITPVKKDLPIAQRALEVFSKYEIFDN